jgi:two-component system, chemotaxis family, response regulator Rcp1
VKAELLHILLVEESPSDARLTREALRDSKIANELSIATDGTRALDLLRTAGSDPDARLPDIVILDLNLPGMDGREVLREIKSDPGLCRIPVAILTTSSADRDVVDAYDLGVSCYLTKPLDLTQFVTVVQALEEFWFGLVRLPPN